MFRMMDFAEEYNFSNDFTAVEDITDQEFQEITGATYVDDENDIYYISAYTGDDAVHFTNSMPFVKKLLSVERDMDIRVSMKDTGISRIMGNFAEEWILTPLTSEMSWNDNISMHKNEGMSWAFDSVKLKNLSKIRKSGGPDRMADSSDKTQELIQRASWAEKDWLTYDDHQLASILGKASLDISDGPYSPLLFPSEGGIGAVAEWGNINSLLTLLGRYGQKRSALGTYLIMKESHMINQGFLDPKDALSTKAMHLSQVDPELWKQFVTLLDNPEEAGFKDELEVWKYLDNLQGKEIPVELEETALTVESKSFVEGTIISRLRQLGLIMTELDVRLAINASERNKIIGSYKPAGVTLREVKEAETSIKSRPLYAYRKLANKPIPTVDIQFDEKNIFEDFKQIAKQYLEGRMSSIVPYTGFSYRTKTRIFRTKEVSAYLPSRDLSILEEQLRIHEPAWIPMGTYDLDEGEKYRKIEEWVNSGDLATLFDKRMPLGASTDDARLISDLKYLRKEFQDTNILNIVVSNDKRLFQLMKSLLKDKFDIANLSINHYLGLCQNIDKEKGPRNPMAPFYNIFTRRTDYAPKTAKWGEDYEWVIFHFDVPNIEKACKSFSFLHRTVTRYSTGFLKSEDVRAMTLQGYSLFLRRSKDLEKFIRSPSEMVFLPTLREIYLRR